jgi:hypothetical protein
MRANIYYYISLAMEESPPLGAGFFNATNNAFPATWQVGYFTIEEMWLYICQEMTRRIFIVAFGTDNVNIVVVAQKSLMPPDVGVRLQERLRHFDPCNNADEGIY